MIRPSQLLALVPGLPPNMVNVLTQLRTHGDPALSIPGLPPLPPIPVEALRALVDPVAEQFRNALSKVDFECYQTFGVRVRPAGADTVLGGAGFRLVEVLNIANPKPNLTVTPILELGGGKP